VQRVPPLATPPEPQGSHATGCPARHAPQPPRATPRARSTHHHSHRVTVQQQAQRRMGTDEARTALARASDSAPCVNLQQCRLRTVTKTCIFPGCASSEVRSPQRAVARWRGGEASGSAGRTSTRTRSTPDAPPRSSSSSATTHTVPPTSWRSDTFGHRILVPTPPPPAEESMHGAAGMGARGEEGSAARPLSGLRPHASPGCPAYRCRAKGYDLPTRTLRVSDVAQLPQPQACAVRGPWRRRAGRQGCALRLGVASRGRAPAASARLRHPTPARGGAGGASDQGASRAARSPSASGAAQSATRGDGPRRQTIP